MTKSNPNSHAPPFAANHNVVGDPSSSSSLDSMILPSDLEKESSPPEYGQEKVFMPLSMTEKGDIEAYPDGVNDPQNEPWSGGNRDVEKAEKEGKDGFLTRISTRGSWKDPGPPPDGGWEGWTQAAGHLVIFNTWGLINSFGAFQTHYTTTLLLPPSTISWIGSIQIFLLFFVGTFSGRLTDAGYFRPVFLLGSCLCTLGLFMASLSTQYWQLFLAQGVCCGLGYGCMFCPALSLLSTYFSTKRSLAIGIAAAGSATGGMVFPAMVSRLLPEIGFPWTMRALGFIQLGLLVVCNLVIKPRVPPRTTGALVDWKSFKELPYLLFTIGMFFNFWGVYFAFFYLSSYSRNIIHLSLPTSTNLLILLNGVGIFARIIPGFLADRFTGPMNLLIPICLSSSILTFSWIAVSSPAGLYVWVIIYGTTAAAIQSLFPATLSSLTSDLRMAGTRMGMVFTVISFAVLTGPPICGQLIQLKDGGYAYAQAFAGADMFVGCALLAASRWAKGGLRLVKL